MILLAGIITTRQPKLGGGPTDDLARRDRSGGAVAALQRGSVLSRRSCAAPQVRPLCGPQNQGKRENVTVLSYSFSRK